MHHMRGLVADSRQSGSELCQISADPLLDGILSSASSSTSSDRTSAKAVKRGPV